MATAVPLVQDDRFWPDNPGCPLHEEWRREFAAYLDASAVASEHAVDEPAVTRNRGWRRTVMWMRVRGIRPTDPAELTTKPWYRHATKKRQPMVKCTATRPVLTREGKLEMRTRRRRYAPAPNRRLALAPPIERRYVAPGAAGKSAGSMSFRRKPPEQAAVASDGDSMEDISVPQKRRVFDPALDEQRVAYRDTIRELELKLLLVLDDRARRPIERRISRIRKSLRRLDAVAALIP